MKVLVLVWVTVSGYAQQDDRYKTFSAQKRSLPLKTGITMKYVEAGKADGIPVVLLHGYTDTSRSFQRMIEELLRINDGFRIITPDLRGHGETSMPTDKPCLEAPESCFAPEWLAQDVIDLLDQLNIKKANVVGHSMGSVVAQTMALQHPSRVERMVLIGTFVYAKENPAVHEFLINGLLENTWKSMLTQSNPDFRWPADAYGIKPSDLGEAVKTFIKENWVTEPCADPEYLAAIGAETVQTPLGAWIGCIRALGTLDNRKAIEKVNAPTLIIWATQDVLVPAEDQEHVKSAFRLAVRKNGIHVEFKTYGKQPLPEEGAPFNDLGHNLQWAAPAQVAADVHSFIVHGHAAPGWPYADRKNIRSIVVDMKSNSVEKIN